MSGGAGSAQNTSQFLMNAAGIDNDAADALVFGPDESNWINNIFDDDYDKLPQIPAVPHEKVSVQQADERMLRSTWTPFEENKKFSLVSIYANGVTTNCNLETDTVVRKMFPCCNDADLPKPGEFADWMYQKTNYRVLSLHRVQNFTQTKMHDMFQDEYNISNTTTVCHGCDSETADTVMRQGFRTGGGHRSLWGVGTYCGAFPVAIQFALPESGVQTILVCDFHVGHSKIGSPGLFNFGETASGEQILTTTNDTLPPTIYCGSKDSQFSVTYKMCVQFDKKGGITQGNVDFMKEHGGSYLQGWKPPKINVPSHAPAPSGSGSHVATMAALAASLGRPLAPVAPATTLLGRPVAPVAPSGSGSHIATMATLAASLGRPLAPVAPSGSGSHIASMAAIATSGSRIASMAALAASMGPPVTSSAPTVAPVIPSLAPMAPAVVPPALPKLLWYQQPSTLAHYSKAGCQASAPIMISEDKGSVLTFEEPPMRVTTRLDIVNNIKVGDVVTIMDAIKLHKFCKGRQGHVKAILQESGKTPRFFIELIDASTNDIRDITLGNRSRKARYEGMLSEWLNSTYPEIELYTGLVSAGVPSPLQAAISGTASVSFNASVGGSGASINVNFNGAGASSSASTETMWARSEGKRPHSDNSDAHHDATKKHKQ